MTLARNIAEVIDDLYRQHAPPRNHERMEQRAPTTTAGNRKSRTKSKSK
jgi:hypothetical protein